MNLFIMNLITKHIFLFSVLVFEPGIEFIHYIYPV